MTSRPYRILAVLAVAGLAVQGCGNGSDTPGSAGTPSPGMSIARGDGPLNVGYVLPETGALAFLGPGSIGAVKLALADINAAGGVIGQPVTLHSGDEGDTDGVTANQSVDRLLQSNRVSAVIGPLSSSTTLTVIGKTSGSGTVQCSPAATSPVFTTYADNGYFFRAQASDNLLGPVFANVMAGDGNIRMGYISRADDGGRNLIKVTKEAVDRIGAQSVGEVFYDPVSRNFDAEVAKLAAAKPDGILVYAFDEGSALLQKMIEAGIGPKNAKIYVHSGLRNAELAKKVNPNDPAVIDGVKGLSPAATSEAQFLGRLKQEAPNATATLFAGQAFDCMTIVALAAEAAKSVDPTKIRDQMNAVTVEGTKCTTYADCKKLLGEGQNIDYDGISGPLDFAPEGEPSVGTYDIFGWDATGTLKGIGTVRSDQMGK